MKSKIPKVMAIAAVSGGGKSTVASCLNEKIQNSKVLYFDDYEFNGPEDMIEWIDHGCNPNEWDLSPLIGDIKSFQTEPLDTIILDFPFAYLHSETSNLIDFAVFIDTPLDLAMARRIKRDFKNGSVEDIVLDLDNYIAGGRQGYLAMLHSIKPNSDLVVDGSLSPSEIASIIAQYIQE
ncbi:uridine kinase [Rossellomorea marisflavi]